MKTWTALMACCLAMATLDADAARRLGGGSSVGQQSSQVTPRLQGATSPASPAVPSATGAAPASPIQATAAARPATPTVQPAAPAKRPWGAMLGGLAAGLGLAWLAQSLGLGAEFGQILMFALLALAVVVVVGLVVRSRRSEPQLAFQGAGAPAADMATAPRQYSPDKVGNDASARPWEHGATSFDTAGVSGSGAGLRSEPGLTGTHRPGIPADFDVAGFVASAKRNFIVLQDAWDRSDVDALRAMMTDEMVREIRTQLAERETHRGTTPNTTDVVMLEAQLLGIEDLGEGYMASVEFSGLIREEPSAGPSPFREVWNMTRTRNGHSGWLVAGVQALQ